MVTFFKALLFDWRVKRAIRRADRKARIYGMKFLVLVFKGKPEVVSKQGIKQLIKKGRFSKEFTPQKAEEIAIHIAHPKR